MFVLWKINVCIVEDKCLYCGRLWPFTTGLFLTLIKSGTWSRKAITQNHILKNSETRVETVFSFPIPIITSDFNFTTAGSGFNTHWQFKKIYWGYFMTACLFLFWFFFNDVWNHCLGWEIFYCCMLSVVKVKKLMSEESWNTESNKNKLRIYFNIR